MGNFLISAKLTISKVEPIKLVWLFRLLKPIGLDFAVFALQQLKVGWPLQYFKLVNCLPCFDNLIN